MDLDPEVAAPLSGGGFSNHFPRPWYQDDAVPAFLQQLGSQYEGLYKCVFAAARRDLFLLCNFRGLCSAAGRGIPDISAQALKFYMVNNNRGFYVSGTSCSVPVRLPLPPLCVVRPRASS